MSNAEKIMERLRKTSRLFKEINEITPIKIDVEISVSEELFDSITQELKKEEDYVSYPDKFSIDEIEGINKICRVHLNHDPKLDRKLESTV